MKPFFLFEAYEENTYTIMFQHDSFMGGYMGGSFFIIGARILGLSYPNYLRYMRDTYGAEIRGREGYSYIVFKDQGKCLMAVQELNKNWKEIEKSIQFTFEKEDCSGLVSKKRVVNGKKTEVRRLNC